jgi:hypothetical protein
MADKKKTNWASILQVFGLLAFLGPILPVLVGGQTSTDRMIMSLVGLAMLIWGTVLHYREKSSKDSKQDQ